MLNELQYLFIETNGKRSRNLSTIFLLHNIVYLTVYLLFTNFFKYSNICTDSIDIFKLVVLDMIKG